MAPVLVEVRGQYVDRFNQPVTGTVRFVPSVRGVSSGNNVIVPTTPEVVQLDSSGQFSLYVQATDDPAYAPTGWTYRIEELVGNAPQRAYSIDIPASAVGTGIDLADVAPVSSSQGAPTAFVTLTAFTDFTATFDGGTTGQVLKKDSNADGDWSWKADTVGAVASVDGRTGAVTLGDLYDPLGAAAAAQAAAVASSAQKAANLGDLTNAGTARTNLGLGSAAVLSAGVANGAATLDGSGKLPSAQLPPVAITDTFVVASQAGMLGLSAQTGDVAVRTDINQTFILQAEPASVLAFWVLMRTPTDAVQSVDGLTGSVSLAGVYDPLGAATTAATAAVVATRPQTTIISASGAGSYAIPANAQALLIEALGGGSGGGSGRRGAAASIRAGGAGGAGGSKARATISVAQALALYPSGNIPYTVGAGGAGGAVQTVDDNNGNPGIPGGATGFGTNGDLLLARGGNTGGTGGTGGATAGGAGSVGEFIGSAGGAGSATGAAGSGGAFGPAGQGGGAGGGITVGNAASAGGAGPTAVMVNSGSTGGSGGVVGGAAPTSGVAQILGVPGPGPGGGASSAAGAPQAGAAGLANSGAGGGGGGASLNGNASGAGAAGGSGYIKITALF